MNLNELTPEQVKRQLREAAGWETQYLTVNEFGKFYTNLKQLVYALDTFVEQSNTSNGNRDLAKSKLQEAFDIIVKKNLIDSMRKAKESIGAELGSSYDQHKTF